ncbi:hypothetical protein BC834DRAFT_974241 [Gloeopeniophorella convolvens]|nr:hypothetical protein BC834DRAFT_974241 [Gloeopeniophorella convolvens]
MLNELRDRCGAQGMFVINQITRMLSDMHGISIAGDILVIYIRLASELLLGHYTLPERHTQRTSSHSTRLVFSLSSSLPLVQTIGQRIAMMPRAAGVDACLLDMYVASCARQDEAWYVERLGMTRVGLQAMQAGAADALFS